MDPTDTIQLLDRAIPRIVTKFAVDTAI